MYIYTPLCRYWIALYRYVLVFIVPHLDIELEDNKQFISNIPRKSVKYQSPSQHFVRSILHKVKYDKQMDKQSNKPHQLQLTLIISNTDNSNYGLSQSFW